jgi:hypothetical protein
MTKYLSIAILITGFLVGDAYGEDVVYYCAETNTTGFSPDKETGKYGGAEFLPVKFKLKFEKGFIKGGIEIKGYPGEMVNGHYDCEINFDRHVSCLGKYTMLNFNPISNKSNKRFVLSTGFGYAFGDGDTITISYGTCNKF